MSKPTELKAEVKPDPIIEETKKDVLFVSITERDDQNSN